MPTQEVEPGKHWKEYSDSKYLGAYSLAEGGDRIVTIQKATREEVIGEGGRKDNCTVLYFQEEEKGMILNHTNSKRIEAIYGTGIIRHWYGKRIQLCVEMDNYKGAKVKALRIRNFKPDNPDQAQLKQLADKVRIALDAYEGDDKDDIRQMLAEKKKAGEITQQLLQRTLKNLTDA